MLCNVFFISCSYVKYLFLFLLRYINCLNIILVHECRHFKVIAFIVTWLESRHKSWFPLCRAIEDVELTLSNIASLKLSSRCLIRHNPVETTLRDVTIISCLCDQATIFTYLDYTTYSILHSYFIKLYFSWKFYYACIILLLQGVFLPYLPEKLPIILEELFKYNLLFKGFLDSPQLLLNHFLYNITAYLYCH